MGRSEILDAEKFGERFTFQDVGDVLTELPLRHMTAVEALRAWRWHSHAADHVTSTTSRAEATDAQIATVRKAQRLWNLLEAAMPEWEDGVSIGSAAHRHWPGGRPAN